jgi:hypothetical protein
LRLGRAKRVKRSKNRAGKMKKIGDEDLVSVLS